MTDLFKCKDFAQAQPVPEFPTMAEQTRQTSMRSRDARLPGERKNWQAGVVSVDRPRYGRDM